MEHNTKFENFQKVNNKTPLLTKNPNNTSISSDHELEKKYFMCSRHCTLHCSKTTYRDFISLEYEETPSIYLESFTAKSLFILMIMITLSIAQFIVYRKYASSFNYMDQEDQKLILDEFTIFSWRYQSITIFLVVYMLLSNYFSNKTNQFHLSRRVLDSSHMLRIKVRQLISSTALKSSSLNVLTAFFVFYATRYNPIGISMFFSYGGLILNFFINGKPKRRLGKYLVFLFLTFGFVLYLALEKNMMSLITLVVCLVLGCVNFFTQQNYYTESLKDNSPMTIIFCLSFNSMLVSCLFLVIGVAFTGEEGEYLFRIFGWMKDDLKYLDIFILTGLLGSLYLIISAFATVYLKPQFLCLTKIFEMSLVDFVSIYLLGLYEINSSVLEYILIIVNFSLVIILVEFYNFVKKVKAKKNKSDSG